MRPPTVISSHDRSMPRGVPLELAETWWKCPSCQSEHLERHPNDGRRRTRMHECPAFNGFSVPMVQVTSNQDIPRGAMRHRLVERGDYVNGEHGIPHHKGKAIMAVHTERPDGSNDTAVFAPAAVANVSDFR